jgi:hypothetical protein
VISARNSYEDESNSFTSDDYEVEEINERPSQPKDMSHIGQRLPIPTEKVVLRRTESPVFQPDYEKYKTTAPTVPLRKVQPNASKPAKESSNFLANVKLKKVCTPAPRVEHEKRCSPTFENIHLQSIQTVEEQEEQERSIDLDPYNYDSEHMPSDEFVVLESPKRERRKTTFRNEHGDHHLETTTYASSPIHKSHGSESPARMDNFTVADSEGESSRVYLSRGIPEEFERQSSDEYERKLRRTPSRKTFEHVEPRNDATYPVAAVLGSKMQAASPPLMLRRREATHTPTHPVAALFAAKAEAASPSQDSEPMEMELASAHPVAAIFSTRGGTPEEKAEEDNPSINNVAALFSQRSALITKPSTREDQRVHSEAQTATRAGAPEEKAEDKPSINNVAALFAQRSALVTIPSTREDKRVHSEAQSAEEETNTDNGKLLLLFAQRSSTVTKTSPEVEQKEIIVAAATEMHTVLDGKPALKNDPAFAKYFKMLKMGLPLQVVKHSMSRDGLDPDVMDGDHNQPAGGNTSDIPLKEDPKYTKYFKMLKMGLPLGAVKNAMDRDGEDPSVMDGDHNAPAKGGSKQQEIKKAEPLPKDKFRRTRVHWDTLRQVKSTSIWALVNQDPDVKDIEIDESEFAELFQAELGQTIAIDSDPSKKRNAVKVIDPKRANNGGIVLARLKVTYEEMAVAIDTINDNVMSIEQVQGILEYIPTKDEKQSLRKYMTSSDKDSADPFDELCECEKFMVAMMTVKHSREKVRALLFKLQFRQCVSDLESDVTMVEKACDELKDSVRLRKLLGIVLNIGNRLNTAGQTTKGKAGAFTIDSLLKLNQAKAFDKKTTFLHYIVLIVMRHNQGLTNFKDDLPSVLKADKIYWDQIENDLEEVENQLENVRKIALHEVLGKNRASWSRRRKNTGDDDDMSQDSVSLEEEVESLRSTRIGIFTLQAIKIVSALRESVELTRSKFKKVLE